MLLHYNADAQIKNHLQQRALDMTSSVKIINFFREKGFDADTVIFFFYSIDRNKFMGKCDSQVAMLSLDLIDKQ